MKVDKGLLFETCSDDTRRSTMAARGLSTAEGKPVSVVKQEASSPFASDRKLPE